MANAEEIIWHVDESDRVIGPCLRSDAHRQGLRHRSAHILVFNLAGELFLQKRTSTKEIHPGLWDTSAAGHVEFGESYEDCAKRELMEELGIEPHGRLEPLFKLDASADTGWEFIQVYRLIHVGNLHPDPSEIDDGRWLSLVELDEWIRQGGVGITPFFLILWSRFRYPP